MMRSLKILIAAGGTGGHLFPGMAVAQVLQEKYPDMVIAFAGTKRGLETQILQEGRWPLLLILSLPIKGQSCLKKILAGLLLPGSLLQAAWWIIRFKPDLLLSIGGYAAGPLALAAVSLGIPVALIEPNVIAGRANRILGRLVRKIFLGLPGAEVFFPFGKTIVTGTPIRPEITSLAKRQETTRNPKDVLTIFCYGGSQGSVNINRYLLQSLPYLEEFKECLNFIHQVGRHDSEQEICRAYARAGFKAQVFSFDSRIWKSYEKADLVIARSGANTVAELAALNLPAILIPYPLAADDHQKANALFLARTGGALLLEEAELSGQRLANEIKKIFLNPTSLTGMRAALARVGRPKAAEQVAAECLKLLCRTS